MSKELSEKPGVLNSLKTSRAWIVEDDPDSARAIEGLLNSGGSVTEIFYNGTDLLDAIKANHQTPDIICLDLSLPDISGLELLPIIKKSCPLVPVVVVTANNSAESIERAVQLGVYDYLPKNSDRTKFTTTFSRAVEYYRLSQLVEDVADQTDLALKLGMYGVSPGIKEVIRKVQQLAPVDVSTLISGESGTGKELVAHALHNLSKRKDGPLVAINCAVLPRELIESELFGHERGAFTGALTRHIGAFERAHTGTLFLDEIGELDLPLQAKLLRAVQEKRFLRLGGTKEIASDFRLVVATNRDLLDEVGAGRFRKDLYYRFAVAEITLPALRARSGDVALLAHHFAQEFGSQLGKQITLSPETVAILESYNWPGNVRELQNAIQVALVQCQDSVLAPHHLPTRIRNLREALDTVSDDQITKSLNAKPTGSGGVVESLEEQEKRSIMESMRVTKGRLSDAAKLLGISRSTLYRKIDKYGLSTRGQF